MKKEYIKPDFSEQIVIVRASILAGSLSEMGTEHKDDDPFTSAPGRKPF